MLESCVCVFLISLCFTNCSSVSRCVLYFLISFSIKLFLEHGVLPLLAHHWARPRLAVGACVG